MSAIGIADCFVLSDIDQNLEKLPYLMLTNQNDGQCHLQLSDTLCSTNVHFNLFTFQKKKKLTNTNLCGKSNISIHLINYISRCNQTVSIKIKDFFLMCVYFFQIRKCEWFNNYSMFCKHNNQHQIKFNITCSTLCVLQNLFWFFLSTKIVCHHQCNRSVNQFNHQSPRRVTICNCSICH